MHSSPIRREQASILLHQQPSLLFAHAARHEIALGKILHGSGLHAADWQELTRLAPDTRISAEQYLHLLANLHKHAQQSDTSFMLGQQMLPGHYGHLSQALQHAADLEQALHWLLRWQHQFCPLLAPRLHIENGLLVLYWIDCFGAGALRPFLVEMHMTAVSALCRWLSGERLPWKYCFARTRAPHSAQHQAHLGTDLRFDCQLDAMLLDAAWLKQPWPRANPLARAAALAACREQGEMEAECALLPALYDYLLQRIRNAPSLEQSASALGISSATLKRHLARHGTHFQAELDQVRTHVCLQLIHCRGYDNQAVAAHLGFHDGNNFRRSFKRWTGITPLLLRQGLSLLH